MNKLINIINKFQIPESIYTFKTISNGYINDTYLVSANEKPTFILQRINTNVFNNIESLIHNLDVVLPYLCSDNYEAINLKKTSNGESFIKTKNNEVWRLMSFIINSNTVNTTNNPLVAFEAGKIIGLFHKLLSNFDVKKLTETLPKFHNVNFRYEQFKCAFKNANPENLKVAQIAIHFVEKNISLFKLINLNKLPDRVCHNDTKLNNILFSKTNKALCLIDLDTIMKGTFLYDFGDAARTIVNSAVEDEKNLTIINFNIDLFEAFVNGLAVNEDFLTQKEKELLPISVVLMPFLHGIRALTDYLENNKYYKVTYKTQNLDRCLSLFTFTQLAIDNQELMKQIILKKLN